MHGPLDAMDQVVSGLLSDAVDRLGYSSRQVQWRCETYKGRDAKWNSEQTEHIFYTVGSKGEGISKYFESDHDILRIPKDTLCVSDVATGRATVTLGGSDVLNNTKLLRMRADLCPPGYFLLQEFDAGDNCMSSELYASQSRSCLEKRSIGRYCVHEQAGPALPVSFRGFHMDIVDGFRCACPELLKAWRDRPRQHGWPSPELMNNISKMDAFLVPKGCAGSENASLQWRLCFNTAETCLIRNLTETHVLCIRLYVLLKIVIKDILRPQHKEITSFTLKNLVFWICEIYDVREKTLLTWLMRSLRMLRKCIEMDSLPYYMVPERNLLTNRMSRDQKQALLQKLSALIRTGPSFILESEKLNKALIKQSPSEMISEMKHRDDVEQLLIMFCIEVYSVHKQGDSDRATSRRAGRDGVASQYYKTMRAMVLPDWRDCKRNHFQVDEMVAILLESLLS